MGKQTAGSYGAIREGNLSLEWNEENNTVKLRGEGSGLDLTYDEAGTMWRMLSYLMIPSGASGYRIP